ncbi:hypothetical protein [Mucilaginibacter sp. MD40]|uniref:hypothetical protein n=1 Tax=Mucilaginibacter sp. MD40 TaxID=2029590 RepID=UPI0013042B1C|nr:hypothetical protein [Mucilaginibacter sp. MD40]
MKKIQLSAFIGKEVEPVKVLKREQLRKVWGGNDGGTPTNPNDANGGPQFPDTTKPKP